MKIAVVGAGGFGQHYVKFALKKMNEGVEFVGVVEKYYDTCVTKPMLDEAGVPAYASMEELYEHTTPDLVLIATPPFLHKEQSIYALSRGSYVLCEKPIAPTCEDAEEMIAAQEKYGKWIAIGYQWSYAENLKRLKKDILDGKLGSPVRFSTFASWYRKKPYYARGGGWGGRISKDGIIILDSIASNACAHHLMNMLFLLGEKMEQTAKFAGAKVECLRANHIENFDTCTLRMVTDKGIPFDFYGTHASDVNNGPDMVLEFENGVVRCEAIGKDRNLIAYMKDGSVINYGGAPNADSMDKAQQCIDAIENGTYPVCDAASAAEHTKIINEIYKHVTINDIPTNMKIDTEESVYVPGLYEKLHEAYVKRISLAEVGYDFSKVYEF